MKIEKTIKIWHAKCLYDYPDGLTVITRKRWFKRSISMRTILGNATIDIPEFLRKNLIRKLTKFFFDTRGKNVYDITIGHDEKNGFWSTALVHPKDQFRRKVGYNIVMGRLMKKKEEASEKLK